MQISCAFATSMDTPKHIEVAEQLGYERAWCYDSPALYPDVWMTLGAAAARTSRIGLATGVLIPHLRHPMVTAAAIATLAELAPGRVSVGIGSGFTGRLTMGQPPLRWKAVGEYVRTVQALLRGEEPDWEGAPISMLHPQGFGAPRPLRVPFLMGVAGPKGIAVAHELGDGVLVTAPIEGFERCVVLAFGTVLEPGETADSERVMAAAGHGAAVAYHAMYLQYLQSGVVPAPIEALPGGREYARRLDKIEARRRHLELHRGHLIAPNDHDRAVLTGDVIQQLSLTASADELRARIEAMERAGATEIAYQPAGPDIPRELRAFAEMAGVKA
jgi:5,10-methylenetetrahydromethanopterin reductase